MAIPVFDKLPEVKVFEFVNESGDSVYKIEDVGKFLAIQEDPVIHYSGWSRSVENMKQRGSLKKLRKAIPCAINELPLSNFFSEIELYNGVFEFDLYQTLFSELPKLEDLEKEIKAYKSIANRTMVSLKRNEVSKIEFFYLAKKNILKNIEAAEFNFNGIDGARRFYSGKNNLNGFSYLEVNSDLRKFYSGLEIDLIS